MSLPTPNTRKEQYLNAIATGNAGGLPTPITREEEYLDAIVKGGGSGDGDMKKSVYDSDLDVAGAGGIKAFVNSAVAGKVDKVEGKGLSTNDYTDEDKAIVDSVTGALAEKADTDDIPDLVSDNLAKGIFGNETVLSTDNVPFISKLMSSGKYQRKKFVGCSYVWNQLVTADTSKYISMFSSFTYDNGVFTHTITQNNNARKIAGLANALTVGHKYLLIAEGQKNTTGSVNITQGTIITDDMSPRDNLISFTNSETWTKAETIFSALYTDIAFVLGSDDRTVGNYALYRKPMLIDLTQLFGSTAIADYIYNLEQATAGAGVAKLKELGFFTEDYYAYDPGSVQSVDIKEYKVTKDNIVTTYPLTPTELRGVPQIDTNNNIYADGDEYASDGGHTEKYGIVDLGTKNWSYESARSIFYAVISDRFGNGVNGKGICSKYPFYGTDTDSALGSMPDKMFGFTSNSAQKYIYIKDSDYTDPAEFKTAMSGQYLVYEKATPTTETLTPFDYPQSVGSLEEITDYKVEQEERDVAIPTGHVTEYMGKGGEFTLPTLPETPSVLAYDGHNFFWKPETA